MDTDYWGIFLARQKEGHKQRNGSGKNWYVNIWKKEDSFD